MWALMVHIVYKNGQQYENVRELEAAIWKAWAEVSDNYISDLIESMKNRVYNTTFSHGGHSKY